MSSYPMIIHHGGRTGVTGSCHELRLGVDAGILIDCGLFQGDEVPDFRGEGAGGGWQKVPSAAVHRPLSVHEIDFPVGHLRALVLTHVHIDHCGRIPWLLAAGFRGPIYCSEPSALLLPLMLEDAFRTGISRDNGLTEKYLVELKKRVVPIPYGRWQTIPAGTGVDLKFRLQPAGHILGSAYVECDIRFSSLVTGKNDDHELMTGDTTRDLRIVFSGDLGAPWAPLLPAPKSPWRADVLVLESTYGDRRHEGRRERRIRLQEIIERSLVNCGAVLIPAFALGRTQELLYELEEIIHRNRARAAAPGVSWEELDVILDSPLATRITGAYRKLRPFWDAEAQRRLQGGRRPLGFSQLTVVEDHSDHEKAVRHLQRSGRPCIVIAAGGMCSGGRIVNYLAALLGDPRTDVVFIGYQARGTPGRAIQEYGPRGGYVILNGARVDIRAKIHSLGGYSAHADGKNLFDFVRRMRYKPREIRLVHGDQGARETLAAELRDFGFSVTL